jgi:peptidoglycan LD-endopeptidase LytH
MFRIRPVVLAGTAALILTVAGCTSFLIPSVIVPSVYRPRDDHAAYRRALAALELDRTALGADWVVTGEQALVTPTAVTSSVFRVGYFNPLRPDAAGFIFTAEAGKTIEVTVSVDDGDHMTIFADLFRAEDGGLLNHVASAGAGDRRIEFETRRPDTFILRIQPELLRGGRYFLTIRTDATLGFPVMGKNTDAIWSFFGDPRDGGAREHHGVDIFAPRGTPVLSPADGEVVHVRWNRLGGNTVGVWDATRRMYYYFAHLDEQTVRVGQRVSVGDVVGTVGDTGNAADGLPHLHFGMYADMRDPIDPYHFIAHVAGTLGPVEVDETPIGLWSRTISSATPLYPGVEATGTRDVIDAAKPVLVIGAQGARYRVLLPSGATGYVDADAIEPAAEPLAVTRTTGTPVRVRPDATSEIVAELPYGDEVFVLGWSDAHALALIDGTPLWVDRGTLE